MLRSLLTRGWRDYSRAHLRSGKQEPEPVSPGESRRMPSLGCSTNLGRSKKKSPREFSRGLTKVTADIQSAE